MPLFKKKEKPVPVQQSVSKLRETTDMLEKREQFLQKKIEKETQLAKDYMKKKNKNAALACLKRKKVYEAQIDKLAAARMTIETQSMILEGAQVNLEAMSAMKMGAQSMKTIHKDLDIDKVDDVMDEIQDQMSIANEISDAISQPLAGNTIDEDELLSELDELSEEALTDQLNGINEPATSSSVKMPSVPSANPKAAKSFDEEAELRALEQSMM